MSRYCGPKNRIARRFGANIFGRARNPLLHKQHAPGQHGARRKKKSDYGLQLEEQQKLKAVYGMLRQKQLVNYYRRARKQPGVTAQNLLNLLECRLDTLLLRLKFVPTIFAAQQVVSHGHVRVDGKRVDRRSFQVQPGMKISLDEKATRIPMVRAATENTARETPTYLQLHGPFEGTLMARPEMDQVLELLSIPVNIIGVCEFLAHTS